jgi:hypothetical protein
VLLKYDIPKVLVLLYLEALILTIHRVLAYNKPIGAYVGTLVPQSTTGDSRVYVNNINVEQDILT